MLCDVCNAIDLLRQCFFERANLTLSTTARSSTISTASGAWLATTWRAPQLAGVDTAQREEENFTLRYEAHWAGCLRLASDGQPRIFEQTSPDQGSDSGLKSRSFIR